MAAPRLFLSCVRRGLHRSAEGAAAEEGRDEHGGGALDGLRGEDEMREHQVQVGFASVFHGSSLSGKTDRGMPGRLGAAWGRGCCGKGREAGFGKSPAFVLRVFACRTRCVLFGWGEAGLSRLRPKRPLRSAHDGGGRKQGGWGVWCSPWRALSVRCCGVVVGTPDGIRTRVIAVKGRCPRPG